MVGKRSERDQKEILSLQARMRTSFAKAVPLITRIQCLPPQNICSDYSRWRACSADVFDMVATDEDRMTLWSASQLLESFEVNPFEVA